MIFVALTLSLITCALPVCGGLQLTRQLQERLDAFLKRVDRKFGFCDENYTTAELLDKADARLLGLYKDHNIVLITFYLVHVLVTAVLWN